jgi:4-hydroxybenzoate polyprenyltransferase
MVGVGALAGWVAMTDEVRVTEMATLFCWMFAWEIGGRNIVNDFADVEEDSRLGVKTVPLVYGPRLAAWLTFYFLVATNVAALALQPLSQLSVTYLLGATAAGLYLLLWQGFMLLRTPTPQTALALFNRASLYPPALLMVLIASLSLPLG